MVNAKGPVAEISGKAREHLGLGVIGDGHAGQCRERQNAIALGNLPGDATVVIDCVAAELAIVEGGIDEVDLGPETLGNKRRQEPAERGRRALGPGQRKVPVVADFQKHAAGSSEQCTNAAAVRGGGGFHQTALQAKGKVVAAKIAQGVALVRGEGFDPADEHEMVACVDQRVPGAGELGQGAR